MNGKELALLYYTCFLTGVPKTDVNGVPLKDEQGNLIPEWMRISNPAAEVVAAMGKGRFYQTELIQTIEGDPFRNIGGKNVELAPMVSRGKTLVIFESRYRTIFDAITEKIAAGRVNIISPLTAKQIAGGKTVTTCKGVITDWAIPGNHVIAACGFDHFMYQMNPLTHILEKRVTMGYDDKGKWGTKDTTINTVDVFLFANEFAAADARIASEIAIAKKFEFKPVGAPVDTSHVG